MKRPKLKVFDFEKKYGEAAFLKVCLGALNKTLLDKNIITEEELVKNLVKAMSSFKS